MKIEFDCVVTAYAGGDLDFPMDAAQCRAAGFDGFEDTSTEIASSFEDPLVADEGLIDAGIRFRIADGDQLRGTVSFRCIPELSAKQLDAMAVELRGQLMDGVGEGMIIQTPGGEVGLDWFHWRGRYDDGHVVRQLDDGVAIPDRRPPPSLRFAERGETEGLRAALDAGCPVNATGQWGMTALMTAASAGHEACVGLLLERGANPDGVSESGSTALCLVAMSGRKDIALRLIAAKADIGRGQKPPLYWAANRDFPEICRMLLDAGADPMTPDDRGETPLFAARSPEIIRMLIRAGAKLDFRNGEGMTALEHAKFQREAAVQHKFEIGEKQWKTAESELRKHKG